MPVWCVPELKDFLSKFTNIESKPGPDTICFVAPLGQDALQRQFKCN